MIDPQKSIYATGRRKHAVARVWMQPGNGKIQINERTLEGYFGRETSRMVFRQALRAHGNLRHLRHLRQRQGRRAFRPGRCLRHGISRALCKFNPELRPPLKKAGYLTRDARAKERKKYGQRGARARFQFSKR
jgi:small subunit ribosomal protein S9